MRVATRFRWLIWALPVVLLSAGCIAAGPPDRVAELEFDALLKEQPASPADAEVLFTFAFTNKSPEEVIIHSVRTSCGCTVARVPALPWAIPAGERGEFTVAMDVRGKRGTVTKSVFVNTSLGIKSLSVRALLSQGAKDNEEFMGDRLRNMQIALADRTAIFKGDCASCHAEPAKGKMGVPLYLAACGICHDSHNRASMVPDLRKLPHPTDRDHWIRWITFGRHGSLMPGFAQSEGGPLSDAQIDSLADYLTRAISERQSPARESSETAAARPAVGTSPTAAKVRVPPLPVAPSRSLAP